MADLGATMANPDVPMMTQQEAGELLRHLDDRVADELSAHVAYYERAAGDISQALEHVEETGSEAAVAMRAVQRTMSSVATTLRRRAADLRPPGAAVELPE